jgi:hypothetical protein
MAQRHGCLEEAPTFITRQTPDVFARLLPDATLLGPTALKLRPDLIESVERSLCFRFNIRPWQLVVKMDTNAVWKSLETGKHYRFLAKKEIEGMQAHAFNTCNLHSCKEIWLIR